MPFNSYGLSYKPRDSFREPRPKSRYGFHGGEDLAAPAGTPVPTQFDGKVFRSGPIDGYGNTVVVESIAPNGRKFYTLYGHLGPDGLPAVGADVKAGESLLGKVGTEAFVNSFPHADIKGTHLHWEIISDKAGLRQNGSLGIYSSDTTHRANPDTFDINNPFFPDEGDVPLPRLRPDLGDRQDGNRVGAPPIATPADASPSFDDRFSAVYPFAAAGIGNGRSIGSDGFGSSNIPLISRPTGSLTGLGGSSLLDPVPMNSGKAWPFSTGGQFVPDSVSSRPLYPAASFVSPSSPQPSSTTLTPTQRAPDWRTPQDDRRSAAPEAATPILAQAASPMTSAFAPDAPTGGLFGKYLRSADAAAAISRTAFNNSGSGFFPPDFNTLLALGAARLSNAGRFIGNNLIGSADAAPPSGSPLQGSTAPNWPGETPVSNPVGGAYSSGSDNDSLADRDGSSPSNANQGFPRLVRRTYSQSQAWPSNAGAPAAPKGEGEFSLNDAYLEYQKRLNAR
jgi:murein DD-endopeptidase MepM/ murein hydrolase activator NlpD